MAGKQQKLSAIFSTAERVHKQVNPTVVREAVKSQQPPHVAERYGLRVKPNPGAGNCGMHVVHEHVIKLDKYKGLSLQDVRNRVADELLRDPEYYSGFIVGAQYEEKGRGVLDSVAFNAYVAKTRRPGTYTDHPEWAATRRAFPELSPFVFVSPSTTSYGTKLVQSYFGDQSTCAASKHLGENGVTAESLQALSPDVIVIYFTKSGGGHFESTERVAPAAPVEPRAVEDAAVAAEEICRDSDDDDDKGDESDNSSTGSGDSNESGSDESDGSSSSPASAAASGEYARYIEL
jgi:hypothetical protein